uniref:BRISC and BRCA1-A complex member 2 n=1 Tax=Kalanchoe fedtschenkoi TaxID=63787 RepID=A0A7N0SVG9_KALFE
MTSSEVLPPLIAAQLNHLLVHSPFPVKVEKLWSASKTRNLLDRFTLILPFCLDFMRCWGRYIQCKCSNAAPGVIFGPDDDSFSPFLMEPDSSGNNKLVMSSLVDWNYRESFRLLNLILGLREQYVAYQRKRVGEVEDERIKFEISTILHRKGIEMMVTGLEEVKFGVPLLAHRNWAQYTIVHFYVIIVCYNFINLKFRYFSGCLPTPRLKLVSSADLRALLFVEDIKLPPWPSGMFMAEYLPDLEDSLGKQVGESISPIDVRRRFIEALAVVFGRPLEADSVFCRKSAFLATSGVFTFLVHISLPMQFPRQQPIIMLQSTQHFNSQGSPIKSTPLPDYPWSPRWEASQMAERIFEYLEEECLNFKKYWNEMQHY